MNSGEIWLINLDPAIGAEIRKTRPAIIVSSDVVGRLPLKIIIPIIGWKSHYSDVPWIIELFPDNENKLHKVSGADTFQVRSLSQERFVRIIGKIDPGTMQQIKKGLKLVFEIDGVVM